MQQPIDLGDRFQPEAAASYYAPGISKDEACNHAHSRWKKPEKWLGFNKIPCKQGVEVLAGKKLIGKTFILSVAIGLTGCGGGGKWVDAPNAVGVFQASIKADAIRAGGKDAIGPTAPPAPTCDALLERA